MIGIYKIENLITHNIYIGQSRNIEKRWNSHKNSAFNLKDHNYQSPLYRAFRKYGLENFSFEVIEECLVNELNQKEKFWIQQYNSFFNGYNQTFGGDGGSAKINKDKILGIINDLENTDLTQKNIAFKWDISEEMVQGINTGRYWKHDRKYPIREKKIAKVFYCIDCGKEISKGATYCTDCYKKSIRKIQNRPAREQLKYLIRNYSFVEIGKKYNISDNAIRKWCDAYNLPRKKQDIKKYSESEWKKI